MQFIFMRRILLPHIVYGLAAGLTVWFFHELLLYLFYSGLIPDKVNSLLSGGVIGLTAGLTTLLAAGFFSGNKVLIKRGIVFGGIFGLIGGVVSFFVFDLMISGWEFIAANWLITNLFYASRWLVLALFIGIALGFRDSNELVLLRGLASTAVAGILGGAAITVSTHFIVSPFWSRGVGYIVFLIILTLSIPYFSKLGRKIWIKALNGKLEGLEFEMFKEIHHFGTQSDDDINLRSYEDIRPTHAKLIKYYSGYSLLDNDPFWQTFVNFRNIKEQLLKNGDILKIGKALFQYCTIA